MKPAALLHVGGFRNAHGTRIAKRVHCSACGAEDHITSRHSRTRGGLAYCRACARKLINAIEVGTKAPRQMKGHRCSNCQQDFQLPVHVKIEKGCLCPSCLKGFETWQGSKEMTVEERANLHCEIRQPGLLLRRA